MKNEITIFENPEFGKVRTLEINGEPWFVGKDVAEILGYSNASKAVSTHIDNDDKCFVMLNIADSQNGNVPTGQTKTAIINESGLYSLILASKMCSVKKFKHWITSEVLPSIRKTGKYEMKNNSAIEKPDSYMIENPIERAKRWIEEQEEKIALENKIKADKPLVDFAQNISDTNDLVSVGEFAKIFSNGEYKIGRNKLFAWLRDNGYLNSYNKPYQKWLNADILYVIEKPYTNNKTNETCINIQTYITGKGQIYFSERLKEYFEKGE